MSTASLALWTAILQTTLGDCGHKVSRQMVASADHCQVCDAESLKVTVTIQCLQTSREWRKRDNAAHDLVKFGVKRHPEIVEALARSLMKDLHEEVREEAAESLGKLGACGPIAHFALTRAAKCDRDHATRREAAKALKRFGKRCEKPCVVCSPDTVVIDPLPRSRVLIETRSVPSKRESVPPPADSLELEPAPAPEQDPILPRPAPMPLAPAPTEEVVPPPPQPATLPTPAFPPLVGPALDQR